MYWERAGEISYPQAMFTSNVVEAHVNRRLWAVALQIADTLGVPTDGYILDLGCGDGAFANQALAPRYRAIDGFDKAKAAIDRARRTAAGPHLRFEAIDITTAGIGGPHYDGAFLIGFLHHVKAATPDILRALKLVTGRVVVLEPNGDNLVRKLLEWTPSYRNAGDDSFGTRELMDIFAAAGFRTIVWQRLNLFPNFTPAFVYRALAPLEPRIEASAFWRRLCTVNMFGLAAAQERR